MNRWPLYLTLYFWTIALALPPASMAEEHFQVLSPPDMASVKGKLINLVFRMKKNSSDTVRVTINNKNVQPLSEPIVSYNIMHNTLSLSRGENRIRIEVLQGEETVAEKIVTVFLKSNLIEQYRTSPPAFADYKFHTSNNERPCGLCHDDELNHGAQSQQDETLPACYTCHKRIVDYKYLHGPVSVWACATCHKENSEKNKYAVSDPEVIACRMCHTDELAAWQSEKFGHGPTLAGKCTLCHNPHASDEIFFLVDKTTDLCGACHKEKLTEKHVINGFSDKGHPMKQDPTKNGKPGISCASCHNPHAANNVDLLLWLKKSKSEFCRVCHN